MTKIFIAGEPIPQPRPRFGVIHGRIMAVSVPKKHPVMAWRQVIQLALRQHFPQPLVGAVGVCLAFYLPRPQAKCWKTREMPAEWHVTRPDLDNLAKAVLDAAKGIAWVDDGQIASLSSTKKIVEGRGRVGVDVLIYEL